MPGFYLLVRDMRKGIWVCAHYFVVAPLPFEVRCFISGTDQTAGTEPATVFPCFRICT